MELRIPTGEQLAQAYERDLQPSFPPAELKPLRNIERMWREGRYRPWCLFDGEELIGESFLWLGHDGWGLLDYLCVSPARRNGGLGAQMLALLRRAEPGMTIFGATESPAHARDPALARRRMNFYSRCGARTAGYDTDVFGVHYKTLYLADRDLPDGLLMAEHRFIYRSAFSPEKFARHVRIPRDPDAPPLPRTDWDEG